MTQVPAGWYPDPHADNTERWWGGTAWTANTRPMNPASAATSQPPVPASVALPPAGWYPDPQNAAGEKWYDGADWTEATRPRADQPPLGGAGLPGMPAGTAGPRGLFGFISGQMQQGARNPQGFYRGHRQGLDAAAGGALLVDGLVGLPSPNGHRRGVFSSLKGIAFGLVFVALSFIVPSGTMTPANMSATATGTVTRVQISQGGPPASGSTPTPSTCVPVAEFGVSGKTYTTASGPVGFLPCPWRVGQQVAVAYDPASPASAMTPNQEWAHYLPWIFAGFGALMTIGSLISFVRSFAELSAGGFLLMRMWRRRKP